MSQSPPPSPVPLRRSPSLEEQLQEKRQELGFAPPKIYEGRKSQKRSAVEMLERSRRLGSLHGGKRKTRRRVNRKRRFSRKK